MQLTTEELKKLSQLEVDMDAGRAKYVRNRNMRWAFPEEIFMQLNLVSGQEVTDKEIVQIMETNIAFLSSKIIIQEALCNKEK